MMILVSPLVGVVLFPARLTRLRRLGQQRLPASSGIDQVAIGRALAVSVVPHTLLALLVVIGTTAPLAAFARGPGWLALPLLVAPGTALSLAVLLRAGQPLPRAVFALLCRSGLLGLGREPAVWRLSDHHLSAGFWPSPPSVAPLSHPVP